MVVPMSDPAFQLAQNISYVKSRIVSVCKQVGRDPQSVRLLPVTKTKPVDFVLGAYSAGCTRFAENRVQEMVAKQRELEESGQLPKDLSWAIIGPLQSNKAKQVAELAAEFQALDSTKIAKVLNNYLASSARQLDVMIQVNTSGEATKSGIKPEEVISFAKSLAPYECLNVTGLMTIATLTSDQGEISRCFKQLATLRDQLRDEGALGASWNELSMGMSSDYELAIKAGATVVRVGSTIFGQRY